MPFASADAPAGGMVDILEAFGPLAAMHAALDQAGVGLPCSSAAYFPGRREGELGQAIGRVAAGMPVLTSRMRWHGERPMLQLQAGGPTHLADPLAFRPDDTGVWGYRLAEEGGGVWLVAAFAHAAADGPSMLRFLSAVARELDGASPPAAASAAKPPTRRLPMAAWLPGFLLEHARSYDGLSPANRRPQSGASFTLLPPAAAERLQLDARGTGAAARLAAAAASCLLEQQRGRAEGLVYLNVPISRTGTAALGGFGFDGSSVRLPLRLSRRQGLDALAMRAGEGLKARIDHGWDLNLLRFLSGPPWQRQRFAAVQARKPPDPCLTISWKGRREGLGKPHGVSRVACFAAAPTLHLSAHVSDGGLSLSLTSPQAQNARQELLSVIAERLALGRPAQIHELSDLTGGG